MSSRSNNVFPLLALLGAAALSLGAKRARRFLPVRGEITSPFGSRINPVTKKKEYHNGVDIAAPEGTPVKVPARGVVANVYKSDIGGLQVVVLHDSGMKTGYAHLSRATVEKGDKVAAGDIVGLSGRTGQVTGPHVHYSVRNNKGEYIDPAKAITYQ